MAVKETNHRVTVTVTDDEYARWRAYGTQQVSREVMRRARAYDDMAEALYIAFTHHLYELKGMVERDSVILGDDAESMAARFDAMAQSGGAGYRGVAHDVWESLASDMRDSIVNASK